MKARWPMNESANDLVLPERQKMFMTKTSAKNFVPVINHTFIPHGPSLSFILVYLVWWFHL